MNRRGFLRILGFSPVAMVAVPAIAIGSVQRFQSGADSIVIEAESCGARAIITVGPFIINGTLKTSGFLVGPIIAAICAQPAPPRVA